MIVFMLPKFIILTSVIFIAVITFFLYGKLNSNPNQSLLSPINNLAQEAYIEESHPLTIDYLRKQQYPGSQIVIEQTLSQGSNYERFLASYQSDGLKIYGLLTKPKGEMPQGGFPAVIFLHGYIPPKQYQTTVNYADYVDYLARNNLVVFKIDLRGHAKSEGEPSGAYYSSDYIVDTLNAYSSLQTLDYVNKIGLWGHSMAGNVVMRSLATKPEIPAAVIWAGAVYTYKDFSEYGIDDNSYQPPQMSNERIRRRQELFDKYGQPKDGNPFWDKVAPTSYLSDLKGSLQIHHAINDNVVSIEYSRNLNKLLNETNLVHELYEYQSGGHNLTGSSFTQAMQRSADFLNKYLKN